MSLPNNLPGIGCFDGPPSGGCYFASMVLMTPRKASRLQALKIPRVSPRHFRIIQTKFVQIEFDKVQLDDKMNP